MGCRHWWRREIPACPVGTLCLCIAPSATYHWTSLSNQHANTAARRSHASNHCFFAPPLGFRLSAAAAFVVASGRVLSSHLHWRTGLAWGREFFQDIVAGTQRARVSAPYADRHGRVPWWSITAVAKIDAAIDCRACRPYRVVLYADGAAVAAGFAAATGGVRLHGWAGGIQERAEAITAAWKRGIEAGRYRLYRRSQSLSRPIRTASECALLSQQRGCGPLHAGAGPLQLAPAPSQHSRPATWLLWRHRWTLRCPVDCTGGRRASAMANRAGRAHHKNWSGIAAAARQYPLSGTTAVSVAAAFPCRLGCMPAAVRIERVDAFR